MKLVKSDIREISENAFSYIVVFAMFAYGVGKIVQFKNAVDLSKTVEKMTGMELMWAFYGHSATYVYILGCLEIIGGLLMLIKTTRLIGCLLVSTIVINIILQDIFYNVNVGALRAAILYQILILAILWFNREKLLASSKVLLNRNIKGISKKDTLIKLLLSFLLFVILRIVEFYLTIKL